MELPLWALFALLCAVSSAFVLILPERAQAEGFALAYWNKAAAVLFMIPLVVWQGLPVHWEFYALVAAQANDTAAFQAALQPLGPLCGQCHQQFRAE